MRQASQRFSDTTRAALIGAVALHPPAEYLLELARGCHQAAKALRLLGQRGSAEQFDARRRVLLDDARQARRRRPHGPRCDERAGYGLHVCAKDRRHKGDCRCRCGEEFGEPF
jgi:hypothetical protein